MVIAAVFSLGMGWYQLLGMGEWHQYLEYDDGVWFGTAVRLAHGILPYRSFVDDQPPGVPVLMLPFALWSRAVGTRTAFAAARLAVPVVGTVGVLALGWVVRHRDVLTVAAACGAMAVYPVCLIDQRTVMLEPFCATLCLLGLAAVFEGDRLSRRTARLVAAGACFGLAGSCKAFALLPFLVVAAALLLSSARARLVPFVAGTAAIFIVVCGPFFAAAPGAFLHDVVVTQFTRTGVSEPSIYDRLSSLVGSPPSTVPNGLSDHRTRALAVVIAVVIAVLVVGSYTAGRARLRPASARRARPGAVRTVHAPRRHRCRRRVGHGNGIGAAGRVLLPLRGLFRAISRPGARVGGGTHRSARPSGSGGLHRRRAPGGCRPRRPDRAGQPRRTAGRGAHRPPCPRRCLRAGRRRPHPGAGRPLQRRGPRLHGRDRCLRHHDQFGRWLPGRHAPRAFGPNGRPLSSGALEHSDYVVLALGYQERRIPWDAPALHQYLSAHFQALTSSGDIILRRRGPVTRRWPSF